ncbi:membrane protein [Brevibacillus reuszeri]|uniref:Membrane protein n=1 Tax=Brevibacillus reuszeri TaxID=54915 RepID=A0A0K9YNQ4_9BACL|nr:YitT family protein [Brevibacillus reuszeri]KNB70297.1 membrane protein [Brevibacillus reuszeri]MED1859260.1 YitT family protein [Brevibacillus reuszeri]GED72244.1 membrane protein [Brevibacillus reuszeri]
MALPDNNKFVDIVALIIGSFLFAVGINLFVIPQHFGEGGVTGVTIILYYLFQWEPWLTSLLINACLLLVGYRFLGKTTTIYTIIVVGLLSVFLHLTKTWTISSTEPTINAIFGGVVVGLGIGLIVRVGGTSAGTGILAKIANKYLSWNVSYALLFFDLIVVFASLFIIGFEKMMMTILMLFVATKVMDFVVEGLNPKKAITIVSLKQDEIAERISIEMNRGVTVLTGYGYYTKEPKEILYTVITKQEVPTLKKIIRKTDKDAFVTIHDARDVFGEGFVDISK